MRVKPDKGTSCSCPQGYYGYPYKPRGKCTKQTGKDTGTVNIDNDLTNKYDMYVSKWLSAGSAL